MEADLSLMEEVLHTKWDIVGLSEVRRLGEENVVQAGIVLERQAQR